MSVAVIILLLGFLPGMLSLVILRRAEQRIQSRLRRARQFFPRRPVEMDRADVGEPHQDWIGDRLCQYNARSPYLRCAINPLGPCETCAHHCPTLMRFPMPEGRM